MLSSFLIDSAQQKAKTNDNNSVHCLMNNQLETTDKDETKPC